MKRKASIKDIITNSLEQVRTIVDADTVLGKEVLTASGVAIIPISKVSIGFASGGVDLPSKLSERNNFGGGGGTGVTVNPIGFLIISPSGKVEMMPLVQGEQTPLEQITDLIDRTPELLNRIKDVFTDVLDQESISDTLRRFEDEYTGKQNLAKRKKLRDLHNQK